jgi:hypothetical protein
MNEYSILPGLNAPQARKRNRKRRELQMLCENNISNLPTKFLAGSFRSDLPIIDTHNNINVL